MVSSRATERRPPRSTWSCWRARPKPTSAASRLHPPSSGPSPASSSSSTRPAAEKGPSASLAPSAARSTYREYASRAAVGRRLAAGPFSAPGLAELFVDELDDAGDGPLDGGGSRFAADVAFGLARQHLEVERAAR